MAPNNNRGDKASPSWASERAKQPNEFASAETDSANSRAMGETVLVVDDNPDVRTLIVKILRCLHYRVLDAESSYAALHVLDENPKVDLLLCDVVMPNGMTGPDLSLAALERYPHLKVLLMSGNSEESLFQEYPSIRHLSMICKPFERSRLARALRELLAA